MTFYIDSDPFLSWRPFPVTTENQFVAHWHEIVFFTFFYHFLKTIAPFVLSPIFGNFYNELSVKNKKLKLDFDIRFVCIIQAIMSVLFCIPMFAHPQFKSNPVDGSYEFAGLAASFTVGYFIWDLLYCCLFHYEMFGFEFLFHAFGALYVFGLTLKPFCQPYLCSFLIFEASTIFVQIHWMFTNSPDGMWSSTLVTLNGVCLIIVFFFVRIIWGVYATIYAFFKCLEVREKYSMLIIATVYTLNLGFQFLNFMWFSIMIKTAIATLKGENGDDKKKD